MSTAAGLLLFLAMAGSAQAAEANQQCLAYAAKREAENQSIIAVKAVSEVVQHRMQKQHKSCRAIVSQKAQFSWWHKNVKMKSEPEWLTRFNEARTLSPVLEPCALYFHSTDIAPPVWTRRMRLSKRVGKMRFYCDREE